MSEPDIALRHVYGECSCDIYAVLLLDSAVLR